MMEEGSTVEKLFVVADIIHVILTRPAVRKTVHYVKVYIQDVD